MNTLTKFIAGTSFLFALSFAPGAQAQSECYAVCSCSTSCATPCNDGGERSKCGLSGFPCAGDCAKNDPQASASEQKSSDDAPACGEKQDDVASEEAKG
ncbi:hypothetical protein ACLESD_03100 [Pyxidicoccus sp. 3LFB2]